MRGVHRLYLFEEAKNGWILSLVGILEPLSISTRSLHYKSTVGLLIVSSKLHFFSLWRKDANICTGKVIKSQWRKSPAIPHPSKLRTAAHREASGVATEG